MKSKSKGVIQFYSHVTIERLSECPAGFAVFFLFFLKINPDAFYTGVIAVRKVLSFLQNAHLLPKLDRFSDLCLAAPPETYKIPDNFIPSKLTGIRRWISAKYYQTEPFSRIIKIALRCRYPPRARCTKCCTFGASPPLPRDSAGMEEQNPD